MGAGEADSLAFSECYAGNWATFAIPAAPDLDALGNVSGACEAIVAEESDEHTVLGQRDVRWDKFKQDAKPGESGIVNAFGSRLKLGKDNVTLGAGGGFLDFDVKNKTVTLAGYSTTAGGGAGYLTFSTSGVGLVSATGAASFYVTGNTVTLTAATCAIDATNVTVGNGAADFVVLATKLLAELGRLSAWLNSHTHLTAGTGTPSPPAVPWTGGGDVASRRVKAGI